MNIICEWFLQTERPQHVILLWYSTKIPMVMVLGVSNFRRYESQIFRLPYSDWYNNFVL